MKGNICLKSFEDLLDDYFNRFSGGLHVGQIASLLELRFYAFLYLGNQIQIENTLNQILNASKNWEMQIFEIWFGKFEIWFEGLKSNYSNRKSFLKQIESNKQDKKIAKLYTVSLIP
ncbi:MULTISPECIES: hypothetical protein [unclassified Myroides]|uniref:hypothetical protein n=1 Tax=unclassified Myroides TaxID=2642485 RepID=UPI003D2F62DA